jgi:putative addiction module CopG family antidote
VFEASRFGRDQFDLVGIFLHNDDKEYPLMPKTMNLSVRLTEPLTEYVSGRVGPAGDYDNASEYVRDLIRRDREREEQRAFSKLKATLQDAFAQPDSEAVEMDFAAFKARRNAPQA